MGSFGHGCILSVSKGLTKNSRQNICSMRENHNAWYLVACQAR